MTMYGTTRERFSAIQPASSNRTANAADGARISEIPSARRKYLFRKCLKREPDDKTTTRELEVCCKRAPK